MIDYVKLVTPSEQTVDSIELATFGDQMVKTGVTVFESEIAMPSSDLIEIAAVSY